MANFVVNGSAGFADANFVHYGLGRQRSNMSFILNALDEFIEIHVFGARDLLNATQSVWLDSASDRPHRRRGPDSGRPAVKAQPTTRLKTFVKNLLGYDQR
jgi:hypothetical protein